MAQTEVFKAQLTADLVGFPEALQTITDFQNRLLQLILVFRDLNKVSGGKFLDVAGPKKQTRDVSDAFREMSLEIQAALKQIPDKSSVEFLRLNQDFQQFRKNMRDLPKGVELEQFGQSLKDLRAEIGRLDESQRDTTELTQRFNELGIEGQRSLSGFRTRVNDIRDGLQLMRADGGSAALGLRQILFGVDDAGNVLGRTLGFLGRRSSELSQAQDELQRGAARVAETMTGYTDALNAQVRELKEVHKLNGGQKADLEDLGKQTRELVREYERMITTIKGGGAVTPAQLNRIAVETQGLERQFSFLRTRGIIPAGSEADRMVNEMQLGLRRSQVAVDNLAARHNTLKQNVDRARAAAKEQTQEVTRQDNVFRRFTVSLSNMFNIFRRGDTNIQQTNQSLNTVQRELQETARRADVVRGAFLGAFGGAVTTALIFRMQDALRSMGREFASVNDLIQNTEVTIRGMLSSFSEEEADRAIAGFTAFVEEQVAATPFEFADAIETAQRLAIQGFDPQIWQRAVSNAAAAMNKPMDQFVGAITRLQAGSTGQAVEMLRDFGLNVNNLSAFLEEGTNRVLTYEEVQAGLTAGARQVNFEFNKQGQLTNDTAEALAVLNGFLLQNSTFANAAAARSQTLSGALSNMKDFVSKLYIELGQPVFERLTGASLGFLEVLDKFEGPLRAMARDVGLALGEAFDFLINFVSNFRESVSNIALFVSGMAQSVTGIFQGDWTRAWDFFLEVIANSLESVAEFFDGLINNALVWGQNFAVQIANGIIEGASDAIASAMEYVGNLMGDFLAPGSPPKKGPLADIASWGEGLWQTFMATSSSIDSEDLADAMDDIRKIFLQGIGDAQNAFIKSFGTLDFAFLKEALSPIKDVLKEVGGTAALDTFKGIRGTVGELIAQINQTGVVNEDMFSEIARVLGKENKHLTDNLRAQLDLLAAQKKLSDVTKEVEEAREKGFVPAELSKRLETAEKEAAEAQERVDFTKALLEFQKESIGLEDEFLKKATGAAAARDAAGRTAAAAAKAAIEKEVESLEDRYERERQLIEQKRELGLLSEEEYLSALISLEKKYIDDSLKEGLTGGLQDHIDLLNDLEARLAGLKGAAPGKIKFTPPTIEEIFGRFAETAPKVLAEVGEEAGTSLVARFTSQTKTRIGQSLTDIRSSFLGLFQRILDQLRTHFTPENLPILSLIIGGISTLASGPILAGIQSLGGSLGGLVARFLPLALNLGRFLKLATAFTGIGGIITLIILNWNTIFPILQQIFDTVSTAVQNFIDRLGGIEGIVATVKGVIDTVVTSVQNFAQGVFDDFIERLGGSEQAAQAFRDAMIEIRDAIGNIIDRIREIFENFDPAEAKEIIVAKFDEIMREGVFASIANIDISEAIRNLLGRIRGEGVLLDIGVAGPAAPTEGFEATTGIFQALADTAEPILDRIGQFFLSLIPPGFIDAIEQIRLAILAFFEEGRLGGELVLLFQSLLNALSALKPVVAIVVGALAALAVLISQVLLAAFQALIDILPFVEQILSGLIRVLRGVIDIFTGVVLVLTAGVQAIVGLFTGDFGPAAETLSAAWERFGTGFSAIWTGLLQIVTNAGLGILTFLISLGTNLVANVASLFGEGGRQMAANLRLGLDTIISDFLGLSSRVRVIIVQMGFIIQYAISSMADTVIATVKSWVETFIDWVKTLWLELVGASIFSDIKTGIITIITELKDEALTKFGEMLSELIAKAVQFAIDIVEQVKQGLQNAWQGVVDFFTGGEGGGLLGPVGEIGQSILGVFNNLKNELVTNSVVPDTTTAIVSLFSTAAQQVQFGQQALANFFLTSHQQILTSWTNSLTTAEAVFVTFVSRLRQLWQLLVSQMLLQWQQAMLAIVTAARAMFDEVSKIIDALIVKINELAAAALQAAEAVDILNDTFGKMADIEFNDLIEALDDIGKRIEHIEKVADRARNALVGMNEAGGNTGGGGAPPAQQGIWNVRRVSQWLLHPGETVLPAEAAQAFRDFALALSRSGIGTRGLPIAITPLEGNQLSGSGNTIIFGQGAFQGAFPNVRSGRDAQGLLDELDRLTSRASLRGRTVGI